MKNLRFLLIGGVAGGAVGAKVGGYMANLLEVPASAQWIESGFIYGLLGGSLTVAAFMVAFAVARFQNEPPAYTNKEMVSA